MNTSLQGLRILNTRPQEQAKPLSQAIQAADGISIELPTLSIQPTDDWLHLLPDLKTVYKAIFISANAVKHCLMQLKQSHIHWPPTIEVIAIGQGSAKLLKQLNIPVHTIPPLPDSEHLLALPTLQQPQAQKILLFKGKGGRPLIEESLVQRGAHLITLSVYQRTLPKINTEFIKSIWRNNLVDIILLTSEQSMHHLFQLFPEDAHYWLRNKTCLVISERLAQSAFTRGIKHIIRSHPEGIMNTLFDYVIKD